MASPSMTGKALPQPRSGRVVVRLTPACALPSRITNHGRNDSFSLEKKGRDSEAPANRPCPLDARRVAPDGTSGHHHLTTEPLGGPDYPVALLLDLTRRPLRSVHRLKADKQEIAPRRQRRKICKQRPRRDGSVYSHLHLRLRTVRSDRLALRSALDQRSTSLSGHGADDCVGGTREY
jgi:hypothetical protein